MSVDFSNNGATDWYEAAGTIALPDADWAIGLWVQMEAVLTGNLFRYPLSSGVFGVNNTINFFADEETSQGGRDAWSFSVKDGANPNQHLIIPGVAASTEPTLLVGQRRSNVTEFYVRRKSGAAHKLTSAEALGAVTSSNLWNLGRRQDGNGDRYFKHVLGDVFVVLNDSLTLAQIEDLARGQKTIFDLGFTPEAYWRLRHPDDLTDQSGNGHALTRNGAPKDSAVTFIGPQPPDAGDGAGRTIHVVDTRKRERAEEKGRRERQRFQKELRTTVDRALRTAIDGKPPKRKIKRKAKRARDDRAATPAVKRKPKRQGPDPKVRDIAALVATLRNRGRAPDTRGDS